jgi:hypothetical protein
MTTPNLEATLVSESLPYLFSSQTPQTYSHSLFQIGRNVSFLKAKGKAATMMKKEKRYPLGKGDQFTLVADKELFLVTLTPLPPPSPPSFSSTQRIHSIQKPPGKTTSKQEPRDKNSGDCRSGGQNISKQWGSFLKGSPPTTTASSSSSAPSKSISTAPGKRKRKSKKGGSDDDEDDGYEVGGAGSYDLDDPFIDNNEYSEEDIEEEEEEQEEQEERRLKKRFRSSLEEEEEEDLASVIAQGHSFAGKISKEECPYGTNVKLLPSFLPSFPHLTTSLAFYFFSYSVSATKPQSFCHSFSSSSVNFLLELTGDFYQRD